MCVIDILVMLLLKHDHSTPLDQAYYRGHSQVVKFLTSKGAKAKFYNKVSIYIQNSYILYCIDVKLEVKFIDIHVYLK